MNHMQAIEVNLKSRGLHYTAGESVVVRVLERKYIIANISIRPFSVPVVLIKTFW